MNVITKSGTNRFSGSLRGNFRDSDIGYAKDPVAGKVTPFTDQQIASSFGGPIIKDKLHFFAYQDYDHNPSTGVWTTPYPKFNVAKDGLLTTKQGGIRFDYQISPARGRSTRRTSVIAWSPTASGKSGRDSR